MSGDDELYNAQRRVGEAVLGRHGVHAVSTERSKGEVVVRVDEADGGIPETVMNQAKSLAEPFGLRVVPEGKATFAGLDN